MLSAQCKEYFNAILLTQNTYNASAARTIIIHRRKLRKFSIDCADCYAGVYN